MTNNYPGAEKRKPKDRQLDDIKMPPHSFEAEQSIIGGLLLDNNRWDSIADLVISQDFYNRSHRIIFSAAKILLESSKPLDLITLSEHLEQNEELEEVGGFAYLADLAKNTPSAANIVAYAQIVSERSLVRKLIGTANEIAEVSYDPQGRDAHELVNFAESKIYAISEERSSKTEGPQSIDVVMEKTIARIEELYLQPESDVTGVDTGFVDLNRLTAGLQPSDLVIVAARPSMGKTTFAMNVCENAAMAEKKPIVIFSLEMPAEQIMMRMLASLSHVDQTKIRTGQLNDEDWARITSTIALLNERKNIFIDDSAGLTPTELRSRARRIAKDHGGISLIMVDYLQLMRVPSIKDNRTLEIAEISRSLKALAKELKVPVVALSQLNRSLEQRTDKRPVNSDLRESGSIEQDADLIMFIYRDEVYHPNSEYKGTAEIIIGKHRNGPIGSVRLAFQGNCSKFSDYANGTFND